MNKILHFQSIILAYTKLVGTPCFIVFNPKKNQLVALFFLSLIIVAVVVLASKKSQILDQKGQKTCKRMYSPVF